MELLDFYMPPFSRIAWVSKKVKDEWEPKLLKAKKAFDDLELETVAHGLRKCMTRHTSPDNIIEVTEELAKKGLIYLPLIKVGIYSGFTHRHPGPIGNNWKYYGVVSNNINDALLFKQYSENDVNHKKIGELLGYPKCCTEFFINKWVKGYVDPVWQQAENTDEKYIINKKDNLIKLSHNIPFESNVMLKYIGLRIIPHISCSLNCENTNKMAKEWLELGHKLNIDGIKELEEFLKLPVEWDCLKGIAYITTPLFKIETNSMTCYPNYVVQKMGTSYPLGLPRGLKFPYRMEQSIPKEIILSYDK